MGIYILQRLATIVVLLSVVSVLVFGMTRVLPGDVAKVILGQFATEETIKGLEEKLGLKDPWYIQYWRWFRSFLRGDMGKSLVMDRPISPLIVEYLQRSLALTLFSFAAVGVLGIVLGALAAVYRNRGIDHAISLFSFFGISVPEFFWGIVLILLFASILNLLPSSGYIPLSENLWGWLKRLIMPTMTLAYALIAHVSRLTRSSMIEVLMSNYIRYARAKGMPEKHILWKHALKNALMPAVTVLALNFGWLIGGIVVVETVFAIPGFGSLTIMAIRERDLPMIQATAMIMSGIYAFANLGADLLYSYLDPRIRYESRET
jgi:peptide/nickel transport system permease protein